jgi:hypothetical protein
VTSSGDLPTFYIVCDTSGSMAENGKRMLIRSIARTIEQYIRLGYGSGILKLVFWNETASLIEWNPDDDFSESIFECHGSTNADALCAFFDSAPEGRIIVLTDGCWSGENATVLKRWRRKLPPDMLRIIKIGSEAGSFSKREDVFSPDEILPMLDGWLPLHGSTVKNDEADEW